VRVRDRSRKGEGFAAATFAANATTPAALVRRALDDALHAPPTTSAWRDEPIERRDLETRLDLPSREELATWLERAWGFLAERVREADGASPRPSAWVEAAVSTEAWVDDLGTRAVRARRRAWAMALFRGRALPDAAERPRFLAGRDFGALDAGTWSEDFDDSPGPTRLPDRSPDLPWVLSPQAAASLVPALVAVIHAPGRRPGGKVGAGWSLHDDPLHERGLVGGAFDDVGFDADRVVLAEGGIVRRALDGPGTFRRPSYRDRPAPYPTTLVLTPPDVGRPERYYRIQALRLHPLEADRWVLELDGVRRQADAAVEVFQGARAVVRPQDLVERCVGGVGEARAAAWGVVTPGLVFEGLRLE
jgi:predicted Zn-dependent protease